MLDLYVVIHVTHTQWSRLGKKLVDNFNFLKNYSKYYNGTAHLICEFVPAFVDYQFIVHCSMFVFFKGFVVQIEDCECTLVCIWFVVRGHSAMLLHVHLRFPVKWTILHRLSASHERNRSKVVSHFRWKHHNYMCAEWICAQCSYALKALSINLKFF